jgi:hypothetical protein
MELIRAERNLILTGRFNPEPIIHGLPESLFASEVLQMCRSTFKISRLSAEDSTRLR